ncbi:MAG: hypothetical protein KF753_21995 [Caldilineaceae bacterium]|nr:hypothetical protein [Caldilineaceae bacterium]
MRIFTVLVMIALFLAACGRGQPQASATAIPESGDSPVLPTPVPGEMLALLGFDFPLPEGAHVSVVDQTANILTRFSVAEARQYLEETLAAAGFAQVGEPIQQANDVFSYTFQKEDRRVKASVFSLMATKTTIQIGVAQ